MFTVFTCLQILYKRRVPSPATCCFLWDCVVTHHRGQQAFLVNDQIVIILGFVAHIWSL